MAADKNNRETPPPNLAPVRRITSAQTQPRVVAITGAQSFLGRNLVGLFEESRRVARVISLDTDSPATSGDKTRHYDIDLTRDGVEESLFETLQSERVDTLVHVGFLQAPTHAVSWAHELESVGTMHVLNACRRAQVRKVVMWSQTLLYGASPTNPNFLSEAHPLRPNPFDPYCADKVAAENEALHYGRPGRGRLLTILRTAPILGPTVDNYHTRYFKHRFVPTVMGFDPLWQFLHEADAVAAFKLAVDRDAPGVFNIVGDGVLPLSTALKLAGGSRLPMPRTAAELAVGVLWAARGIDIPTYFLDYLQYLCVADGSKAKKLLGFAPVHTSREALIDFANAQHLRDASLLAEATP